MSLYGRKAAAADYWKHFRQSMLAMSFSFYKYDPDMWFRSATKPDSATYYQYILLYTDDILCIMTKP